MTEGYQDRDDPGLTVRFPLVDRPGEALLVWTTTPWTLTSNVAAAVGPELPTSRSARATTVYWLAQGHRCGTALEGPFEVLEERPGRGPGRLALRGPVRRPAGRQAAFAGRPRRPDPYEHRVVAWDEVGEDEGTGHRPHRARLRRRGLRAGQGAGPAVIAPLDEYGVFLDGFGCAHRARRPRRAPSRSSSDLEREGCFYRARDVHATATRTAGAAARRSSSGWSTSGSSAWARCTTSRARS